MSQRRNSIRLALESLQQGMQPKGAGMSAAITLVAHRGATSHFFHQSHLLSVLRGNAGDVRCRHLADALRLVVGLLDLPERMEPRDLPDR